MVAFPHDLDSCDVIDGFSSWWHFPRGKTFQKTKKNLKEEVNFVDKLLNKHTIKVIHYLFDIDYNNFQDLMYLGLEYTWVQFS